MKVLVIQLRQLGDILLTTPVIRALRQAGHEVHALTHPMGKRILAHNPWLTKNWHYADSLTSQLQMLRGLRAESFELAFDFMGNPRSAFYCVASGARSTWAFSSSRDWLYTHTTPRESGSDYIVKEKYRLLTAAGINIENKFERLDLPWFETDLGPHQSLALAKNRPTVVISATHRRENRKWPPASYAALSDHLARHWQAQVIWIWGPGEEQEVEAAIAQCKEPAIKAPRTTFSELAALLGQCDLFIGNSNGPSHVAVSCNVPSLQLHGPTDYLSWTPATSRHQALAADDIAEIHVSDVTDRCDLMRPIVEASVARGPWPDWNARWSSFPIL
jgi:ADP-heptose:LPS heptosyltransferase